MKLTEADAVRIGNELRKCAHGDAFDFVIESLHAQYTQQIMQSDYGDTTARENAFRQSRALDELVMTINTFIAIAEADALEVPVDEDNIFD